MWNEEHLVLKTQFVPACDVKYASSESSWFLQNSGETISMRKLKPTVTSSISRILFYYMQKQFQLFLGKKKV